MNDQQKTEFEKAAGERAQGGLMGEVWGFLKENKKWWLLPIVAILFVFGLLIVLSGTALAPFIYPLF